MEEDAQRVNAGVPFIELNESPLAPGASPVRIRYRESGRGAPLIFLHGGWGYEVFPFGSQAAALDGEYRIIIPDRSGYGESTPIDRFEPGFHRAAAVETLAIVDALGVDDVVVWGHSDGAVIATLMALRAPARIRGIILEATHLSGRKPSSRAFFETIAADPDSVGIRVGGVLARDHGEGWRNLLASHSRVWLRLADEQRPNSDFYDGRLGDLQLPTLIVHGARDPRTEPGELDEIRARLAHAEAHVFPDAGHSPHSEAATASRVTEIAAEFLSRIVDAAPSARI